MVKSKRYKDKRNFVQRSENSDGKLTIVWDGVNERQWDAWMERISPFPIEQTWSYGQAFAGVTPYQPAHGVIYNKKLPLAIVQVVEWRIFKFLRIAKIVRGPLFFGIVSDDRRNKVLELIYQRYSFWNFDLLLWTPESSLYDPILKTFNKMRMRKVVTGYSSVLLDLCQTEETLLSQMDSKWRNQLKKSEKQGLKIKLAHQGDKLDWLLNRHEESRKSKRLRMPASPFISAISLTMRNKQGTLIFTANKNRQSVSGILVFKHGATATYYVGWNSEEGRLLNANNLLLWFAIKELKARGVKWFDLGGVDGFSMPGVSRYKMGLGGNLYTLAGTYF
tara:strand:- start:3 stop:1004 length:1002 start_codon:yes stop_codon:yes gene_type:complete